MARDIGWGNLGNTVTGERALWGSVVKLAVADCRRFGKNKKSLSLVQTSALSFVFQGGGMFEAVLHLAEIDPDRARRHLMSDPAIAQAVAMWRAAQTMAEKH